MRRFLRGMLCIAICLVNIHMPFFQIAVVMAENNSIEVSPVLSMPIVSYEGHTEMIYDGSIYRVGNKSYTAKTAYEEGIATSEFVPYEKDGIYVSNGDIISERKVKFYEPGSYSFQLILNVSDGSTYTARDTTNVLATPSIEASLYGAQKQNRKQTIDFKIASNPSYPVQNIKIEIKNSDTGEKAVITAMSEGNSGSDINNSEFIKIGNVSCNSVSEGEFFEGRVEFLTKYTEEKDLEFIVNSSDIRGQSDEYIKQFTVSADKAPEADIDIDESYIRETDSDTAIITVSDSTIYDGDQGERSWFVKEADDETFIPIEEKEGYSDLSLGAKSSVQFHKTGVGKFKVKLSVKDIWSEGTLEQYTDRSEILSGEVTEESEVINIAPYVTMGMKGVNNTKILVAGDKNTIENKEDYAKKLKIDFLENGIDADISMSVKDSDILVDDTSDPLTERFTATGPFGYNGTRTAFEENLYIVDDSMLYRVDAVWSDADKGIAEEPFTLTAYGAESGEIIWQYMFDSTSFSMDVYDANLYQDASESYLYLVSKGKTMIVFKKSGQLVSVIEHEFGQYSFVGENRIFTFCSDGIYSVSLTESNVDKIYSAIFSGEVKLLEGKAVTFIVSANGKIFRILLDPDNGNVEQEYVDMLPEKLYSPADYTISGNLPAPEVIGIDIDGTVVISQSSSVIKPASNEAIRKYNAIVVYDSNNNLLKSASYVSQYEMYPVAIENLQGQIKHYGFTYGGIDFVTIQMIGIEDDYSKQITLSNDNGRPCVPDKVINAVEHDGVIKLTLGANCSWIYNDGWCNGPRHGYPERCITVEFDKGNGTVQQSSSIITGGNIYSEYGNSSDLYIAIQTSRNCQYAESAAIETVVVRKSYSPADLLIKDMKKHMEVFNEEDVGVLLLYAELYSNGFKDCEIAEIKSLAKSRGYKIYIAGEKGGNGETLAASLNAVYVEKTENYIKEIAADYVASNHQAQKTYVNLVPDEQKKSGSLNRLYSLAEGEEYYFEMEFKGTEPVEEVISVSNNTDLVLENEVYLSDSYYVTDFEKEDFSDAEYNDFFSYSGYNISNGLFTDCYISKTTNGNDYRADTSEITFTVPKGEEGIISFDFRLLNVEKNTNDNYIDIDGKRWLYFGANENKLYKHGSYVHPIILKEGKHTITLGTSAYGSQLHTYTYIDNLKYSRISKEAPKAEILEYSYTNIGDDRYKVTGKFTTPLEVTEFKGMKNIEYVNGVPGIASYTQYDDSEKNERNLSIDIPSGKKALLTILQTDSYVLEDNAVIYKWINENTSWVCRGPWMPYYNATSNVPDDWQITIPPSNGIQQFQSTFHSYRNSSAEYKNVEMYLGENDNSLIKQNQFICGNGSEGQTLFLGENRYNGETIVNLDFSGNTEIYSFSLFMNNKGQKSYIADNDFSNQQELNKWNIQLGTAEFSMDKDDNSQEDSSIPVFEKGELVTYEVSYDDYENDPSKKSYWRYYHTPMTDGPHEDATFILDLEEKIVEDRGILLDSPIERFYVDGKYTVEHWQIDDTTKGQIPGGNPDYDKESNLATYTFYIRDPGEAPWVKYIQTNPSKVYKGDNCSIVVSVDDMMKEKLQLNTEIYKDGVSVYKKIIDNINPNEKGTYELVHIDDCIISAECGKYTVVCTVSDESGTGMDTYTFDVRDKGFVEGSISHTEQWESNRQNYNSHFFQDNYNELSDLEAYCDALGGVPRGTNVFWAGEKMLINIIAEGEPEEVTAWVEGYEEKYLCRLHHQEKNRYTGVIWDKDMFHLWSGSPEILTVCFKVKYEDKSDIYEEKIIMDGSCIYWQLHKTE